ncbi:MAG TPA: HAD-IIIA family hydrolase [Jatrophihabitantaceae bacterium]|nr:HAD-IIIA family hydrolase [Jatrophihabitantaceae bacterium]
MADRPAAVLFDRDGTLIRNVPHNVDPAKIEPMPTAAEAVRRLRDEGIAMAVVSNQSVVGRGWATTEDVARANAKVAQMFGGIGPFFVCPHAPDAGCECRKPKPGLIRQAAAALGVSLDGVVVIGDRISDLQAAMAAGARAIMVPSADTPDDEIAEAAELAATLGDAVAAVLPG